MHIVLVEPEIPQNTGSIARLAAATGSPLHLVGRLGFSLEDRYLKRAGLDYWPLVDLHTHDSFAAFLKEVEPARIFAFSTHATTSYTKASFAAGDAIVFGSESKGLPADLKTALAPLWNIPMSGTGVRSLNLANAVSIVLYEGLRQLGSV
ncbi:MAG: tRNA (cytidine(34)-2'-O)-methyltransferase [Deltaproteobacteria bacterium]